MTRNEIVKRLYAQLNCFDGRRRYGITKHVFNAQTNASFLINILEGFVYLLFCNVLLMAWNNMAYVNEDISWRRWYVELWYERGGAGSNSSKNHAEISWVVKPGSAPAYVTLRASRPSRTRVGISLKQFNRIRLDPGMSTLQVYKRQVGHYSLSLDLSLQSERWITL